MEEMTMMLASSIAPIVMTLLAVKVSDAISILGVAVPGEGAAVDAGGSDEESGRGFKLESHSL
jgi:hypothetical protein